MRIIYSVILLVAVPALAYPPESMSFDPLFLGKPGAHLVPQPGCLAESTHTYDVRHYRLDFDLPMTNAGYACHEQVSLASEIPELDTVVLDFAGLVCDSVKRANILLDFTTPVGSLSVALDTPLPEDDSTVLDIFFHRESTAAQVGYFFCRPPTRVYAHAMTCGCPRDNHYWFACYDLPSDKAERGCMMNLTVPDTFQTSANGLCDSVTTDAKSGRKTYWWRHPYPIATYLMTFSASRFASWGDTFLNTNGDTVEILHFMWPQDSSITRTYYQNLKDMLAYFSDTTRFGPYPFGRFGFIPGYYGFPWGGMEHQTVVMMNTGYLGNTVVQAHELSHMWWGDMVTHVGYADVWLNEGFATWAEVLYTGHQQGRTAFDNLMRARANSAFSQDRGFRFPIYNPPWNHIYNYGTIYCKGAWVEHMLRFVEGDTAWENPGVFFRALRAYRDSFPYGTVSTEDYRRINEQVTELDLGWFFDEWIYQAGYPRYFLNWEREPVGDSFRVILSIGQTNGDLAPYVFHMPVPVELKGTGFDTLVTMHPQANPEVDTFMFPVWPDSVTVDPDNWILDSTCYFTGIAESESGPGPRSLLLSVLPNPASGDVRCQVAGQPGSAVDILVSDRSGRIVSNVRGRLSARGRTQISWNRTGTDGRRLPAGVYFLRLSGTEANVVTKLVLTR